MQYFGKIIGVIFGIISGTHIWGVIIGFIIGYIYDKALEFKKLEKISDELRLSKHAFFFISTFQILGHLTKAKGKITEVDIKLATDLMDRMRLYGNDRILAKNAFKKGKERDFLLRETIRKLRRSYFYRFDLIQTFIEIQIQAAFADNNLHPYEEKVLFIIAEELDIPLLKFKKFLDMINSNQEFNYNNKYYYNSNLYAHTTQELKLDDAYKMLGVKFNDEKIKIKHAYLKLMAKHHPDKLVAKGLSKEIIEISKKKHNQFKQLTI